MTDSNTHAKIDYWLSEPIALEVRKSIEKLARADDVERIAIMPDVHLARDVCIGAVVATSRLIYPAAVGSDIGCGMAAVRIAADTDLLNNQHAASQLLDGLLEHVPSNKHRNNQQGKSTGWPNELQEKLSDVRLEKMKHRDGRVQLGTLGRGNHFLEFQADQENQLWLMVHSGSRGIGQAIYRHHCERACVVKGLAHFDATSNAGQSYLSDVVWAVRYAEENRLAMIHAVDCLLQKLFDVKVDWETLIHANHNHVRREIHFEKEYWVHRKGAQSAKPNEPGIIPGSMGTVSFHVEGRGHEKSLSSSSHGAGRKLSRTDARKTVSRRQFEQDMKSIWFDQRRIHALRDEAPAAYKDINAVMRAQKKLTRIVRELRPVLCYKGT